MQSPPASGRATFIWFSELDRWIPLRHGFDASNLPKGWQSVRIGDVVSQVTARELAQPDKEYRMAGVKWYAEGVFHRETVLGKEMSAKFVTPLVPGALIYNRLFAWKESFAVVGPEHAGLCVSSEFPQFLPNTARLVPEFIYLFCTRPKTIEMVNAASAGSAAVSRNRFKEEEFLKLVMPLPPLAEQREIVDLWRSAQSQIAAVGERLEKQEASCSEQFLSSLGITPPPATDRPKSFALHWTRLDRWSVSSATDSILGLDNLAESKFEYVRLGELATVSYGIQKCPANRPGQHPRPYLRVANVRKGYLDLSEIKQIDVPDSELESYRLQDGDILFVEGNGSRAELGRVAKWSGEIADCVHQNHLIKVRVDASRLSPDFAMIWFNTEIGRSHFFRSAKTSSGLGTINSNEVRRAPIPLPTLEVQRKLVERVTAARMEIARERAATTQLRETIAAEIEAMILGAQPVSKEGG